MITKGQVAANPKEAAQMIAVLTKENARLRAALSPFAEEGRQWSDSVPDSHRPGVTEPKQRVAYGKAEFTIGHCRRAAKLLATS